MKKERILTILTFLLFAFFFIYHLVNQNYEFVVYIIVAILGYFLLIKIRKKYDFPFIILIGFVVWMVLHLVGGTDIAGVRMYARILLDITGPPLYFLRYDQLLHFYLYIVVGALFLFILKKETKKVNYMILLVAILAAVGVGAGNEILEFTNVLLLTETGVGDYFNNSFDLVMNTLGAILGVFWAHWYLKRKKK